MLDAVVGIPGITKGNYDLDADPYAPLQSDSTPSILAPVEERQPRAPRNQGNCYGCGQPGHRQADCPKNPRNQRNAANASKVGDEIPPSLKCPLCKGLLEEAVITSCCGDTFCEECLSRNLLSSNCVCPNCKETVAIQSQVFPNQRIRDLVTDYRRQKELPGRRMPTREQTSRPILRDGIRPEGDKVNLAQVETYEPYKLDMSLFKIRLCRNWEQTGDCTYGDKCLFAHGMDELKPDPVLGEPTPHDVLNIPNLFSPALQRPRDKPRRDDDDSRTARRGRYDDQRRNDGRRKRRDAGPAPSSYPGPSLAPPGPPRCYSGPCVVKQFTFSSHHDGNGIIYYLGMDRRTGEWRNPVDSKQLRVCASSLRAGSLALTVDHDFNNLLFQSDDIPFSWAIFDFGERSIRPNYYTLAHRSGVHAFFLRSWQLEGSIDNVQWNILSRHDNDDSIGPFTPVASWPVPAKTFYRYLRVVLDPNGNSEGGSALVFNCFEVYGELKTPAPHRVLPNTS